MRRSSHKTRTGDPPEPIEERKMAVWSLRVVRSRLPRKSNKVLTLRWGIAKDRFMCQFNGDKILHFFRNFLLNGQSL